VSGDNFSFDITGASLRTCLEIAFSSHSKAVGWAEIPRSENLPSGTGVRHTPRLVLFWTKPEIPQFQAFLTPMTVEQVEPIVRAWLAEQSYGREPDHDGDNGRGWRVYNEAWTHVAGMWQAFVAIEPEWIMYGK